MLLGIGRRHEFRHIAAGQLRARPAEQAFRSGVQRLDYPAFVNRQDSVHRGVDAARDNCSLSRKAASAAPSISRIRSSSATADTRWVRAISRLRATSRRHEPLSCRPATTRAAQGTRRQRHGDQVPHPRGRPGVGGAGVPCAGAAATDGPLGDAADLGRHVCGDVDVSRVSCCNPAAVRRGVAGQQRQLAGRLGEQQRGDVGVGRLAHGPGQSVQSLCGSIPGGRNAEWPGRAQGGNPAGESVDGAEQCLGQPGKPCVGHASERRKRTCRSVSATQEGDRLGTHGPSWDASGE